MKSTFFTLLINDVCKKKITENFASNGTCYRGLFLKSNVTTFVISNTLHVDFRDLCLNF